MPSALTEVIESMPAMVESWRSSGVATEEAMVSGLAPGTYRLIAYADSDVVDEFNNSQFPDITVIDPAAPSSGSGGMR